ncbi:hypothetical protein ITJ57_07020 [Plantibacter sp. VKM Ac-2880]|uniref:hypothetical protein n=1 Tax=Plantibacter sp. VKM Ac-2880 TaxID=2783827 RepID=UPI00188FB8B2|nr:hypothetical protein [Plantibacter sp. VKM Ac-2880]MBF4568520.1 hypothetical protein [Plantibacter sp. VKM Ac-2880]
MRRASLSKHGVLKKHLLKVSPHRHWLKGERLGQIAAAAIRLPVDDEADMSGRSFDGIDLRFVEPVVRGSPMTTSASASGSPSSI